MKTELMLFNEDKYIDKVLTFKAGHTYEISVETGSVTRWLKRGAVIVEREEVETPVVQEAEVAIETPEIKEEVVIKEVKKETKKIIKSSK